MGEKILHPHPQTFVGSSSTANVRKKNSEADGSPSLYQANLHQKLLEHSVPAVEDFRMTKETVEGFLDFCIFVYSEGEDEKIALSDIYEFFSVSQRSIYRFKQHPVADGIEMLLRHLSTLVFQCFESGPEEWLKCLKKKGVSIDEMMISESEFVASAKLMLSHNKMESHAVGESLNSIGLRIVSGYLNDVTSSLLMGGVENNCMSGLVLIDVVNHYYMEDKCLLRKKEEVEASAADIELCLARRGVDVMRMFSAEDLDRDGFLEFGEVRRSLLKIKEVLDVKHDHADLIRAMEGLKTESLDDTNDVTGVEEGESVGNGVEEGEESQSRAKRKAQHKESPTRSRHAPLQSTRSIKSISMTSVASHRTAADPLHMTRQQVRLSESQRKSPVIILFSNPSQHRQTKLYNTVMNMLANQKTVEEKKRAFIPVTNVKIVKDDDSPLMASFLEKLGIEDGEEKVVSRKRKVSPSLMTTYIGVCLL